MIVSRNAAVLAAAVLLAGTVAGCATKASVGTLEAERLVLRNQGGEPRVVLAAEPWGASIVLLDEDGLQRVAIEVKDGVPKGRGRLVIYDDRGTQRVVIGQFLESIGDADVVIERPPSSIVLRGEDGAAFWRMPAEPWGWDE